MCKEYEKFYKSREDSFIIDIFYNLIHLLAHVNFNLILLR